jgi:hypothetical protein
VAGFEGLSGKPTHLRRLSTPSPRLDLDAPHAGTRCRSRRSGFLRAALCVITSTHNDYSGAGEGAAQAARSENEVLLCNKINILSVDAVCYYNSLYKIRTV